MNKLYLYEAKWGYWGSCADPGDNGYYSLITSIDEVTMRERMRAAAEELGDKYDHGEFLKTQTDGMGFSTEYGLDQQWGDWTFEAEIVLDEIKREDLWSEEKMSEIIAERQRAAEEKRQKEKREQERRNREWDERQLKEILKRRPELKDKI